MSVAYIGFTAENMAKLGVANTVRLERCVTYTGFDGRHELNPIEHQTPKISNKI